jgi:hypothetical protein
MELQKAAIVYSISVRLRECDVDLPTSGTSDINRRATAKRNTFGRADEYLSTPTLPSFSTGIGAPACSRRLVLFTGFRSLHGCSLARRLKFGDHGPPRRRRT